jgi:hypothetical protein
MYYIGLIFTAKLALQKGTYYFHNKFGSRSDIIFGSGSTKANHFGSGWIWIHNTARRQRCFRQLKYSAGSPWRERRAGAVCCPHRELRPLASPLPCSPNSAEGCRLFVGTAARQWRELRYISLGPESTGIPAHYYYYNCLTKAGAKSMDHFSRGRNQFNFCYGKTRMVIS